MLGAEYGLLRFSVLFSVCFSRHRKQEAIRLNEQGRAANVLSRMKNVCNVNNLDGVVIRRAWVARGVQQILGLEVAVCDADAVQIL